jgi:hypothetical protein
MQTHGRTAIMKHFSMAILVGALLFCGVALEAAEARPSETPVISVPVLVAAQPAQSSGFSSTTSPGSGRGPLKAVLIVGPIDGDEGPATSREKEKMELAAAELEANGVTVYKFYTPENDWSEIRAGAQGAHFLLYRGHGVAWSSGSEPIVGGFALKGGLVSREAISYELELAPNAVVMLYGCFTAGTSNPEEGTISGAQAQNRVAQYSVPFFEAGAAGYYASWFGDAFQFFVRSLFQGMTLGQAYQSFYDFDSATAELYPGPAFPDQVMWLDKDYRLGTWLYNHAFVGLPGLTLEDLFGVQQGSQAYVTYLPLITVTH